MSKKAIGVAMIALASSLGFAISVLFFAANVQVVYCVLREGPPEGVALVASDAEPCVTGLLSSFAAASVDYSAITPFLLCLFTGWMCLNCVLSLMGRINHETLERRYGALPFHRGFETTWVQLGLTGTIWGFILIGWGLRGDRQDIDVLDILLRSFGTALLSTFTGVVLAYVVAPPCIAVWNWLHSLQNPDRGLAASVNNLNSQLANTTRELASLTGEVEKAKGALAKLAARLPKEKVDELANLVRSVADATIATGNNTKETADNVAALATPLREIKLGVNKVSAEAAKVATSTARAADGVEALQPPVDKAAANSDQILAEIKNVDQTLAGPDGIKPIVQDTQNLVAVVKDDLAALKADHAGARREQRRGLRALRNQLGPRMSFRGGFFSTLFGRKVPPPSDAVSPGPAKADGGGGDGA